MTIDELKAYIELRKLNELAYDSDEVINKKKKIKQDLFEALKKEFKYTKVLIDNYIGEYEEMVFIGVSFASHILHEIKSIKPDFWMPYKIKGYL